MVRQRVWHPDVICDVLLKTIQLLSRISTLVVQPEQHLRWVNHISQENATSYAVAPKAGDREKTKKARYNGL